MTLDADILHLLVNEVTYGFLTGMVLFFWKKVFTK